MKKHARGQHLGGIVIRAAGLIVGAIFVMSLIIAAQYARL